MIQARASSLLARSRRDLPCPEPAGRFRYRQIRPIR